MKLGGVHALFACLAPQSGTKSIHVPPLMHVVLCAGRGRSTASVVQAQEQMRGANDAFLSLDLERLEAMEEAARLRSEIGRLRTAMGGRLVSHALSATAVCFYFLCMV